MSETAPDLISLLLGKSPADCAKGISTEAKVGTLSQEGAAKVMKGRLDRLGPSDHDTYRALHIVSTALGNLNPFKQTVELTVYRAARQSLLDYASENNFVPAAALSELVEV